MSVPRREIEWDHKGAIVRVSGNIPCLRRVTDAGKQNAYL